MKRADAGATLVMLIGPPAVGKMTVGRALERLTGLPLFHNHMSIELVLPFFPYGSPPFQRLVGDFRRNLMTEVAQSGSRGLIFTYVWAFDLAEDHDYVAGLRQLFAAHGGRAVFVELWADLETRLRRNATAERLAEKPSKRDLEASRARLLDLDSRYRLTSDGRFPWQEYLRIDNSALEPDAVARRIATHFDLPLARYSSDTEAAG